MRSHKEELYSKTIFGFWVFIVTDFMVFASLFAAYDVLQHRTFGGPGPKELFELAPTLIQTLIFLFSSFTAGLGGIYAHRLKKNPTIALFSLTFLLGFVFVWMSCVDFQRLILAGHDQGQSAFLSMYYTLVGTFLVHVIFGLLWILLFLFPVFSEGITSQNIRRLTCLKMFWQFLNIVWIFIFTIVYLLGVK